MSERTVRYRITAQGAHPEAETPSPDAATWTATCQHPIYFNMSPLADPDEIRRCVDCGETWTVPR